MGGRGRERGCLGAGPRPSGLCTSLLDQRRLPQPQLWHYDDCSSTTGTAKGRHLQGKRNVRFFPVPDLPDHKGTSSSTQMPWSCPHLLDSVGIAGGLGISAPGSMVLKLRCALKSPGRIKMPDAQASSQTIKIRATGYGTQAWGLLKELQVMPIYSQG